MELPKVGPNVYGNSRVVVIDKPAGSLSVPSRIGAEDERVVVGRALEKELGIRLWPVHRLDAEVSGLLIFAKDADTHRVLCAGFEHHQVHKTYLAWTVGPLPTGVKLGQSQRWQSLLLRGKKRAYVHAAGKEAVTVATPLVIDGGRVLWRLCPQTGRPHQLRVELSRRGCPILGDSLYGSTLAWGQGIALRAVELDLAELVGREELELPPRLTLLAGTGDHQAAGRAWFKAAATASASKSVRSTQLASPTESISAGAG